jgi:hypothetical protein
MSRLWLLFAALLIGVGIVTATNIALSLLTGRPFSFFSHVGVVQMMLVAFPFVLLALLGARHWLPWIAGIVPTVALWSWILFQGVRYQRNPDGSGADIGLGLMLLGSPLVIAAICVGIFARQKCAATGH